ncbi:MAG: hypothetical protein K2O34_04575, partial [Acetatifactor sp.]|nr:hypothetical protein [Acetatifactor sp.]
QPDKTPCTANRMLLPQRQKCWRVCGVKSCIPQEIRRAFACTTPTGNIRPGYYPAATPYLAAADSSPEKFKTKICTVLSGNMIALLLTPGTMPGYAGQIQQ